MVSEEMKQYCLELHKHGKIWKNTSIATRSLKEINKKLKKSAKHKWQFVRNSAKQFAETIATYYSVHDYECECGRYVIGKDIKAIGDGPKKEKLVCNDCFSELQK